MVSGFPTRYVSGQIYHLTVSVSDAVASRWGFEVTVVDRNDKAMGSLIRTDTVNTQSSSLSGRDYLKQTNVGTFRNLLGTAHWTMDWKAPAPGSGRAELFASGLSSDDANGPTGDHVYLYAQASVEDLPSSPSLSLQLNPATSLPRQGSSWQTFAHITNHDAFAQTVTLVPRLHRPNGSIYPSSGWLSPPQTITVGPGAVATVTFSHAIPAGAPLAAFDYECLLGFLPGTLVDQRSFPLTVIP